MIIDFNGLTMNKWTCPFYVFLPWQPSSLSNLIFTKSIEEQSRSFPTNLEHSLEDNVFQTLWQRPRSKIRFRIMIQYAHKSSLINIYLFTKYYLYITFINIHIFHLRVYLHRRSKNKDIINIVKITYQELTRIMKK